MRKFRLKLLGGYRSVFILLFTLFSFISSIYAQSVPLQVKGKVTDSKGMPLTGVTVKLKGATIGASTDVQGEYLIRLPDSKGTLVFTYLGYSSKEIDINGKSSINVVLEEDNQQLDEVVVVGYGTQKKVSVTGAISTIQSADLIRTPAVAATSALVGKVAGVTARTTDGRPGNGASLQIRNLGSPLYVIDGVPYSTNDGTTSFGFNTGVSGVNAFNNIGLEDIESITVLKDASASIYGLRASNGVVLVTTKKGKKTEIPTINVSSYYGVQNFTRYPYPGNAPQYVRGRLESEQNQGRNPSLLFTPDQFKKWQGGTEPGYKSYDYFKFGMRPNVPQYYLSANASGGSQRSNYYFSLSHLNQDAIIKDFNFNRTNLQANLSSSLAKGLTIGTQISARVEKRHNVGVPGLDDYFNPLLSISSMWPTESAYANDNPLYINQTHSVNINPATYTNEITGYVDEVTNAISAKLNATYEFKFGLTAKVVYAQDFSNENFDGFEFTYPAYIYNAATDVYQDRPAGGGALYGNQNPWREIHKRNITARFAQFQLNYNKQFGSHSLSAVAAYERSDNENRYNAVHTIPPNNYITQMLFANQDFFADDFSTEARAGYIGRINYDYKQKYLLEVLGRYDGSYLFAPDKRWGFFPGVSVGWRMTEEKFLKDKFNFLNDLKLRASVGSTGSEIGINAFDYMAGYSFAGNGIDQGRSAILDGTYNIGVRPRGLPITNLSWVINQTKNMGIDFTVFKNISGQFDIFERKRTGLPASKYDVLLPSEAGYLLPNQNLNSDATRGADAMVAYSGRAGKVDYSIGVNGTLARRRDLTSYKPRFGNSWNEYRTSIEDRWGNINWGHHIIGRFQSQSEIDAYRVNNDAQGNKTLLPGDFIYKDENGDGIINAMDQRPIGYAEGATPYFNYGINSNISWKGFALAFDFSGGGMQSFFRNVELKYPFQNNGNSPGYMLEDRWHRVDPYDTNSAWVAGTYPALRKDLTGHSNFVVSDGNNARNDFWMTNVRYLRLRNLELGYNIPQSLLKKVGISRLRVYANGTNLFSFDNVKDFQIDPEISSNGGVVYPQQRLYNFGINLTL